MFRVSNTLIFLLGLYIATAEDESKKLKNPTANFQLQNGMHQPTTDLINQKSERVGISAVFGTLAWFIIFALLMLFVPPLAPVFASVSLLLFVIFLPIWIYIFILI